MSDVMGAILLAAVQNEDATHQIERDDGFISEMDGRFYVSKYEDWSEPLCEALKSVKGRVLDIGCGAGRIMCYLEERGFVVHGIDLSPGAIEACKRNGIENAQVMDVMALDLTLGKFDTILLLGCNFGIPGNYDGVREMLKRLWNITNSRAIILAESRDSSDTDNEIHLVYHEKNRSRGWPVGQVRFRLRYKNLVSDWIDLLTVSPEEMATLAEETGWKLIRVVGPRRGYIGILERQED
ncbi:MAG: class I SAM-dependent methyltransferase [Candidatus Thorarchaeota archaeon]|nr:class I SAM-dependent methyltransferase [Candidatus Thorarchaeota archaeon]